MLSLWIHSWISIVCNVGCEGQHLTSPGRPGILLRGIVGWLEKRQLFRAWWKMIKFFQTKMNHHHSDQSQQIQSNLFVPEFHFPKIVFLPNFAQTSNIEKDQSTLSLRRSCHTRFQSIYHPYVSWCLRSMVLWMSAFLSICQGIDFNIHQTRHQNHFVMRRIWYPILKVVGHLEDDPFLLGFSVFSGAMSRSFREGNPLTKSRGGGQL